MSQIWIHNGFLLLKSLKMSKSLNNFITLNDLINIDTIKSNNNQIIINNNDKLIKNNHSNYKKNNYNNKNLSKKLILRSFRLLILSSKYKKILNFNYENFISNQKLLKKIDKIINFSLINIESFFQFLNFNTKKSYLLSLNSTSLSDNFSDTFSYSPFNSPFSSDFLSDSSSNSSSDSISYFNNTLSTNSPELLNSSSDSPKFTPITLEDYFLIHDKLSQFDLFSLRSFQNHVLNEFQNFYRALKNDLNMPQAMASFLNIIKLLEKENNLYHQLFNPYSTTQTSSSYHSSSSSSSSSIYSPPPSTISLSSSTPLSPSSLLSTFSSNSDSDSNTSLSSPSPPSSPRFIHNKEEITPSSLFLSPLETMKQISSLIYHIKPPPSFDPKTSELPPSLYLLTHELLQLQFKFEDERNEEIKNSNLNLNDPTSTSTISTSSPSLSSSFSSSSSESSPSSSTTSSLLHDPILPISLSKSLSKISFLLLVISRMNQVLGILY